MMETIDIKGKEYVTVHERVKEFNRLYPEGSIKNCLISNENGVCIFKSTVRPILSDQSRVFIGHAYEKEGSSFINKTSYIENCETSAVGRALGFLGIGLIGSIASADEFQNAINNQGNKPSVGGTKLQKALNMIRNATNADSLLSVGAEINSLGLSMPDREKAATVYSKRQKDISEKGASEDMQKDIATTISNKFKEATTIEELKVTKAGYEDEIRTMSPEFTEWLKDEYKSKKWIIENPGEKVE